MKSLIMWPPIGILVSFGLSEIEAGKSELDVSKVPIRPLLQNSLVMIKEKAMKHCLQLSTGLDGIPFWSPFTASLNATNRPFLRPCPIERHCPRGMTIPELNAPQSGRFRGSWPQRLAGEKGSLHSSRADVFPAFRQPVS